MSSIEPEGLPIISIGVLRESSELKSAESTVEKRIQEVLHKQEQLSEAITQLGQQDAALHIHRICHEDLIHCQSGTVLSPEVGVEQIKKLLREELRQTIVIHRQLLMEESQKKLFDVDASATMLKTTLTNTECLNLEYLESVFQDALSADPIVASPSKLDELRFLLTFPAGIHTETLSKEALLQAARKQIWTLRRNQQNEVMHLEQQLKAISPDDMRSLETHNPELIEDIISLAIDLDHVAVLRALLDTHIDINKPRYGRTLLSRAESEHKQKVVQFLKEMVGIVTSQQATIPVSVEETEKILSDTVEEFDIATRQLHNLQKILEKALSDDPYRVEKNLKKLRNALTVAEGIDKETLSKDTVLSMAREEIQGLEERYKKASQYLLEHLKNCSSTDMLALQIKNPACVERICLHAIETENADILAALHSAGVNFNQPSLVYPGGSLLICAILLRKPNMVKLLVEELNVDVAQLNSDGFSPLSFAEIVPETEILKILKEAGEKILNEAIGGKTKELGLAKVDLSLALSENPDDAQFAGIALGLPEDAPKELILQTAQKKVQDLQTEIHQIYVRFLEKRLINKSECIQKCIDMAFQSNQIEFLKVLRDAHVDLNAVTSRSCPLLIRAISENKSELARLLVEELHVDVNQPDEKGYTPLLEALIKGKPELIELLMHLGANFDETESFLKTKGMALIFALGINKEAISYHMGKYTLQLNLQGFKSELTPYFLEDLFKKWLREVPLDRLTLSERDRLQAIIEQTAQDQGFSEAPANSETLAQRVQSGQPLLMQSGVFERHNIGLFFHQNRFYICNRGFGASAHAVEIFEMKDRSLFTREVMAQLQSAHFNTPKEFQDLLQTLNLRHVGEMDQKWQKVGNCTWANLKSAVLAAIYDTLEDRFPDPAERLIESKRLYTMFTSFGRKNFLDEYLTQTPYPSKEIVDMVREKIQDSAFHHFTEAEKVEYVQKMDLFLARAE